jgi:hypothetical protein
MKIPKSADRSTRDNRQAPRQRKLNIAKILGRKGSCETLCTVIDRSETGACIEVDAQRIVSRQFELLTVADRMVVPAKLVWSKNGRAGLKFTGKPRRLED